MTYCTYLADALVPLDLGFPLDAAAGFLAVDPDFAEAALDFLAAGSITSSSSSSSSSSSYVKEHLIN